MKFNMGARRGSGQANGERAKTKVRRIRVLAPLSLALVLVAGSVAFADNVQNNVTVANANDTFVAGGSTTVGYRIQATGQGNDGQQGCNAEDGTPATVTINVPANVTAMPNQLSFSSCNTFQTTQFTSTVAGNYPITVSVSDANPTGGTYNTTQATFILKVTAPADSSPPDISPTVSGQLGNNGWYTGDVSLSWDVMDEQSAVTSTSGCDATLITADTPGQTFTCTATSGGGTASESITIKRDATAPTVSLVGGPADGGSYYFGSVPAAPTCSASDALSGIDGSCSVGGYSAAVGNHTVSATASDKAGNSGSASASYEVKSWTINGFFSPVDMGNYLNTVKGGSTVPLKFRVFAGSEITDVAAIKSVSAITVACPGGMAMAEVEEIAPTGGTVLRYDTTAGQFIYNWKTLKAPGKCYKVTMTTQDGSSIVANFRLT